MWGPRALHAFSRRCSSSSSCCSSSCSWLKSGASSCCSSNLSKPRCFCCLLPHAAAPCSRSPCMQAAAANTQTAKAATATAAAAARWLGPSQQAWRERRMQLQLQQPFLTLTRDTFLQDSFGALRMQRCSFSSGMRNTKAGIKNPYWRRRGFWEWRRRLITQLNRSMRKRKHLFPRNNYMYLPQGHPLNSSSSSSSSSSSNDSSSSSSSSSSMQLFSSSSSFIGENERELKREKRNEKGVFLIKRKNKRKQGGGFEHDENKNIYFFEKMGFLDSPVKGEGRVFVIKKEIIPLGKKRLLLLLRLIKGLQLTDAIDWLQALTQHKTNTLLNILFKKQQKIRNEGGDPSRVYIDRYLIGPAGHVKTMRVGYHYRVSFLKSYRYSVSLRLRELPLHELFHKTFIMKKAPRSLTQDMRICLQQKQLPPEVIRDWLPYLDAHTRYQHKQRLRVLDRQRLFNYMLSRRAFVYSYISRMRQMHEEAAAARGTTLHALQAALQSPKSQLKNIEYPQE